MENIITQVSPESAVLNVDHGYEEYYDDGGDEYGNSLIHLNIQESHYFITRDQLMSLPESLLLCLFPSGVFLDRAGQVITNLTPEDEVYIMNFPPECFEYIMEVYTQAYDDLVKYPVEQFFGDKQSGGFMNSTREFFGFSDRSAHSQEQDLLHLKPAIIVLREDLDYYCVPMQEFKFVSQDEQINDDLLQHYMTQVKLAAGSHLTSNQYIFDGLFSSNRLKSTKEHSGKNKDEKLLGPAEQHLMDMLCSSGFSKASTWGNRTQEAGKTVISSLSLCRLANESTKEFRETYLEARKKWETEIAATMSNNSSANNSSISLAGHNVNNKSSVRHTQLPGSNRNSPTPLSRQDSESTIGTSTPRDKKKSRFSTFAGNVRSKSNSSKNNLAKSEPKLYDLVPRPDINAKLLLFWRKPARKCWWGEEKIELEIEIYGRWINEEKGIIELQVPESGDPLQGLNKVKVPVKLHIRRVWTLELSVVGAQ
ncbi:Growth regulation protein [Nakaseomyces bracarensis]|uniref:Growth regulation protein n=1 Tax=Nakaseomyces bracarensis TaxID=273131 RepID=A0ABR4NXK3_9SACH